jgi:hypothetical protein
MQAVSLAPQVSDVSFVPTRKRQSAMFKTARFKVHNPSRHKATLLLYALTHYHKTLKSVLETVLSTPDLREQISIPDRKGCSRVNKSAAGHFVRLKTPKNWELAPLRDYLIGDATAMLLSHFKKLEKGKNESNPPTLSSLTPLSDEQATAAYREFTETLSFPIKEKHQEKIDEALSQGKVRVAQRMERTYQNYATSRAAGEILRRIEGPLPRPIEFTHTEFGRGALLGRKGNNYYLLVRLFSEGHRYREQKTLDENLVDWRTRELIGGRKYPGVILPLEFDRDFHDHEYFQNGSPQSAKLLARKDDQGRFEFYVHIAFEFKPDPVQPIEVLGIDRGAAKIGAATVIDQQARVIASGIDMEGAAFSAEMARLRERIAQHQRKGLQKGRVLRLRGRKADNVIGEYANRIVELAAKQRSQIAIERIDARSMARFLTQSQFGKLKSSLSYKAERAGLPAPIEVPAACTSQACGNCGHVAKENRPKRDEHGHTLQDRFLCVRCGYSANADDNASHLIALRALHQQLNGGRFQRFHLFQEWLLSVLGRDGLEAKAATQ